MLVWVSDTHRRDGLYVQKLATEAWVIRVPGGKHIDVCPCCDKPMLTRRAARLVADKEHPMQAEQ